MLRSDPNQDDPPVVIAVDGKRPRWTGRKALALVILVGAAAVGGWMLTSSDPTDNRLLVLDEKGAISLLDPKTGTPDFKVRGATATPDRSALLTTETTGATTVLESRDPATGAVTGSTTLDRGDLTVRTVSPKGQAVALMPGPKGDGIYTPEPRARTSLTVSYVDGRPSRTYDLAGNVEPEMFSYDESGLFVLEFVPPTKPDSYYVRRLDLATGTTTDTGSPQVGLNPKMRGRARASILHPGGDQLFTLYTLPQTGEPVFDPEAGTGTPLFAFIHVIDLKQDSSFCVFLPEPIGTVDEASVGMGISPDGDEVIVADPSTATVARIDTADLSVTETINVEKLRDGDAKAAVAMAEDGTVYIGSGPMLLELTRPGLQAARVWSQDATISGLSLSASGEQLRVGSHNAITLIDRATGAESAVLRAPGRGKMTLLGPPRGSVTEFPLECAC